MSAKWTKEERANEVGHICHLVANVKEFGFEDFRRMMDVYKTEMPEIHAVLSEATTRADESYTKFLNAKVLGVGGKYWALEKIELGAHDSVLSKVMSELRERMKSEREYRKDFLVPEIQKTHRERERDQKVVEKKDLERVRVKDSGIGL